MKFRWPVTFEKPSPPASTDTLQPAKIIEQALASEAFNHEVLAASNQIREFLDAADATDRAAGICGALLLAAFTLKNNGLPKSEYWRLTDYLWEMSNCNEAALSLATIPVPNVLH